MLEKSLSYNQLYHFYFFTFSDAAHYSEAKNGVSATLLTLVLMALEIFFFLYNVHFILCLATVQLKWLNNENKVALYSNSHHSVLKLFHVWLVSQSKWAQTGCTVLGNHAITVELINTVMAVLAVLNLYLSTLDVSFIYFWLLLNKPSALWAVRVYQTEHIWQVKHQFMALRILQFIIYCSSSSPLQHWSFSDKLFSFIF